MASQQNSRGSTPTPAPGNNAEESSEEMNCTQGSHHSDKAHPWVLDKSSAIMANINSLYAGINTYHFLMSSRLGHANQTVVRLNDFMSTLRHQEEVLAQARQQVQTGGIPLGRTEALHLVSENGKALIMCQDFASQFRAILNETHHIIEQEIEAGLSEAQLQSLPTTHISIQQVEDGTICNVCLMDYTEGEIVCQLSCSHLYRINCITRWLTTKTTYPTCRRNLQEESAE